MGISSAGIGEAVAEPVGPAGADGTSVAPLVVYARAASQPTTPTGGSFDFSTSTLTEPTGGTEAVPAHDGNPLWASRTKATATGTGTDSSLTWDAYVKIAEDGEDGASGVVTTNDWLPLPTTGVAEVTPAILEPPGGETDYARRLEDVIYDTTGSLYGDPDGSTMGRGLGGTSEINAELFIDPTYGPMIEYRTTGTTERRSPMLVDPAAMPALAAGDTLRLVTRAAKASNTSTIRIEVIIVNGGTANERGYLSVDLTTGNVTVSYWPNAGATSPTVVFGTPTNANVTLTDNGDGTRQAEMFLTVQAGESVPAGNLWLAYSVNADSTWNGDGSDVMVRFAQPSIFVSATAASQVAASAQGHTVDDPSTGTHQQVVPLYVGAVAAKPSVATIGAVEITGTNASGTGYLIARVDVTDGAVPQLWVSEDHGATSLTMSLPADQWTTGTAAEVALGLVERRGRYEIVMALDRVVVAGIPLSAAPSAIVDYRSRLSAATAVVDGDGLDYLLDGGYRASTVAAELSAVTQIPGLQYVELGAS